MIGIKNITNGRFGNRILHYNNLVQISKKFNIPFYCNSWEGNTWFENILSNYIEEKNSENISWKEIHDGSYLQKMNSNCHIDGTIIHNFFYELTHIEPKSFLKIKKEYLPNFQKNTINVGIHIRGGDIRGGDGNNSREVHTFEYYKKSIDFISQQTKIDQIYICTDDVEFQLVKEVFLYCRQKFGHVVFLGPASVNQTIEHIYDFALLTECDYLIASSSTYAICAGLLGKDKKIIHSQQWLEKNIQGEKYISWGKPTAQYPKDFWDSYDNFWIKVSKGENKFYKPWIIL